MIPVRFAHCNRTDQFTKCAKWVILICEMCRNKAKWRCNGLVKCEMWRNDVLKLWKCGVFFVLFFGLFLFLFSLYI